MNRLETQAIIEQTKNYDEEETEQILKIYDDVVKHIGFEDKRRDNRYIVKFHDIFYYTPEELQKDEDTFNSMFEDFCNQQVEYMEDYFYERHIDIGEMLHPMYVGHYQAFIVNIPNITEENAAQVAMDIFDEFGWEGDVYASNYVTIVDTLQDLEDNYMEYWIEFLDNEAEFRDIPKKYVEETKNNYEQDKGRK